MIDRKMIRSGSRPVFWSVKQQRILAESDFEVGNALRDSVVSKLRVRRFGGKAGSALSKIEKLYP